MADSIAPFTADEQEKALAPAACPSIEIGDPYLARPDLYDNGAEITGAASFGRL